MPSMATAPSTGSSTTATCSEPTRSAPPAVACWWCGKSDKELLKCTACRAVAYCSVECQRTHWTAPSPREGADGEPHKRSCKRLATAASAISAGTQTTVLHPIDDFPINAAKPSEADFAVGLTPLGSGNFSTVYRATYRRSGKAYALKTIAKDAIKRMSVRHPNIHNEVLQEKAVGGVLRSPMALGSDIPLPLAELWASGQQHIATLYSTFQDAGNIFYVYELLCGGEVWEMAMQPVVGAHNEPRAPLPLPPSLAAAIVMQVALAVAFMHARGIVHRDLKPENIIVDRMCPLAEALPPTLLARVDGYNGYSHAHEPGLSPPVVPLVKVVDFATCKDMIDATHNSRSEFVGTPDYMPPEAISQAASGNIVGDSRVDLWALGAILYQLLAGCAPFKSESQYVTMEKVMRHGTVGQAPPRTPSSDTPSSDITSGTASADIDGLLFTPGFPLSARTLVHGLLARNPKDRLGVVPTSDDTCVSKQLYRAGVLRQAPPLPPAAAGAIVATTATALPPAASLEQTSTASPAATAPPRRQKRPHPATKPASATLPPTLPSIDHNVILQHPFFAQALGLQLECNCWAATVGKPPASTDEILAAADTGVDRNSRSALSTEELASFASQLASGDTANIAEAMSPAGDCCGVGGVSGGVGVSTASLSKCVAAVYIPYLLHLCALKKRIHAPRVRLALAAATHPSFKHELSLGPTGATSASRHVSASASAYRCLRALELDDVAAGAGLGLFPYRLGEYSPREILGWNVAPTMYSSPLEQESMAAWHLPSTAISQLAALRRGGGSTAATAAGIVWGGQQLPLPLGTTNSASAKTPPRNIVEPVNSSGWRLLRGAEFHSPFYAILLSNVCSDSRVSSDGEGGGGGDRLPALCAAIDALDPPPRAVICTGYLTATAHHAAVHKDSTSWPAVSRDMSRLITHLGALKHRETSIVLQGAECIDTTFGLQACEGGDSALIATARAWSSATCAWLSGSRWVFVDPKICLPLQHAPSLEEDVHDEVAGTDTAASTVHTRVEALRDTLPLPSRWLHEASELTKVGALHAFLVLRRAASGAELAGCQAAGKLMNARKVFSPVGVEAVPGATGSSDRIVAATRSVASGGSHSASVDAESEYWTLPSLMDTVVVSSLSDRAVTAVHLTVVHIRSHDTAVSEVIVHLEAPASGGGSTWMASHTVTVPLGE